jgi:signal peptidase II
MVLKSSKRKFKAKSVKTRGYYIIFVFLILILIDRMSKIWASNLKASKDYGIFAFTYITNTGAGFSIMNNMNTVLIILSAAVLIAIIYFNNYMPKFSLMTITAGITGNLIDRISYGSVIDFINFKFWPVFNIADSLICIGVIYWIILIIREEIRHKKEEEKRNEKSV